MAQLEHSTPQHGEGSPASVVCSTCRTHRHDGVACRVALNGYRMRTFLENSTRFGALNVDAFNIYELAARHALAASPLIDAQGKPGAPRHVHTVIVGATPAARAVLLETLRMLHLYDDQARVITVVAPDAETELRPTLYREYPCLDPSRASELGAVSSGLFPILEFVELPRSNATWMSEESRLGLHVEPNWRTNVFFCIDDGMKSRALAYTLTGWLSAAQQEAGPSCQTCISYFSDYPEEADLPFAVGVSAPDTRPRPIGCNVHQLLVHGAEERLARELSAMFLRRYPGPLTGVLPQSASEWDCFMRNYWATRSEWERDSNRQAADHIAVKLRLLGHGAASDAPITELRRQLWITEDEGGRITDASEPLKALAGVEHRRWCAERLLGGWQPLPMTPENLRRWFDAGHTQTKAARDAFRNRMKQNCRRHIDLVPFEQLKGDGFDERSKDYWTIAMIPALLDQVSVHKSVRGLQ